jgi:hypothetical protein
VLQNRKRGRAHSRQDVGGAPPKIHVLEHRYQTWDRRNSVRTELRQRLNGPLAHRLLFFPLQQARKALDQVARQFWGKARRQADLSQGKGSRTPYVRFLVAKCSYQIRNGRP